MIRRFLTVVFLFSLFNQPAVAQFEDSLPRNYPYQLRSSEERELRYGMDDFDGDGKEDLILVFSRRMGAMHSTAVFSKYEMRESRWVLTSQSEPREVGIPETYLAMLGIFFRGVPFPFILPYTDAEIPTHDMDGDGDEELLFFVSLGGSSFSLIIMDYEDERFFDMGMAHGLLTILDVDGDGALEMIGRRIPDSGPSTVEDKTFFLYRIVGNRYENVGLIPQEAYTVIINQQDESFRLRKNIWSFGEAFVTRIVHGPLEEAIAWFYTNRDKVTSSGYRRVSGPSPGTIEDLQEMEQLFIAPAKRYLSDKQGRGPEIWEIFQYRPIDDEYLRTQDRDGLRLLRNYFYALHGYIFKSQDLQRYFSAFAWYKPSPRFEEKWLSQIERINVDRVLREEQRR
jgi:hypothetical protein